LNSKTFQLIPIICSKNKFKGNYVSLFSSFKEPKNQKKRERQGNRRIRVVRVDD
jgi:hypothetical protein